MKKIRITPDVLLIAEEYRNEVLKFYKRSIIRSLKTLQTKLSNNSQSEANKLYVNFIIEHLDEIILLTPQAFDKQLFGEFDFKTLFPTLEDCKSGQQKYTKFANAIIKALHYKEIRSKIIPSYVKKLGIRTCVYCNANWATTFTVKNGSIKERGYYEIDHFKPQSQYPHLCISFFNLQPCCGGCNKAKLAKPALFNLYEDDNTQTDLNPFVFEIDKISLAKYYTDQSTNALPIIFKGKQGYDKLIGNHNNLFHIDKLYQAFNPEVEELIWRHKVYNKAYVTAMAQSFKNLFPGKQNDIFRLLYGFYISEEDIHKRPLTKLYQDIFSQLQNLQTKRTS